MRHTWRVRFLEWDGSMNEKLVEAETCADAIAYVEAQPQCRRIHLVEMVVE